MRWSLEHAARAAGAVGGRGRLRGEPQLRPEHRRQHQPRAAAVPLDQQRPRQHGDQFADRERDQSVCRPDSRRDAEQRHDAAAEPAAAVSAVRQRRRSPLRRLEHVRLGAVPARAALQRRLHRAHQLHLVELQGAGDQAERHRHRLRRAIPGHPPAASPGDERHLGAALRPRPALRQRRQSS